MLFCSSFHNILLFLLSCPSYKRNNAFRHIYKKRLVLLLASCVLLARLEGIKLPNINYPNNMLLLNHDAAILQKSCGKIWLAAQFWGVKRSRVCEEGGPNGGMSTHTVICGVPLLLLASTGVPPHMCVCIQVQHAPQFMHKNLLGVLAYINRDRKTPGCRSP